MVVRFIMSMIMLSCTVFHYSCQPRQISEPQKEVDIQAELRKALSDTSMNVLSTGIDEKTGEIKRITYFKDVNKCTYQFNQYNDHCTIYHSDFCRNPVHIKGVDADEKFRLNTWYVLSSMM